MERTYFVTIKGTTEKTALTVDFTGTLASNELVLTAVCTVAPVVAGGLALSGVASITGNQVTQLVELGTAGSEYVVTFTVTTTGPSPWLSQTRVAKLYIHVE